MWNAPGSCKLGIEPTWAYDLKVGIKDTFMNLWTNLFLVPRKQKLNLGRCFSLSFFFLPGGFNLWVPFQPPSRCRIPWRSKTEARRSEAPRPKRRRSTSKRSGRTWSTWRRKPRVFVFFLAHRWAVLPAPVFFLQGFEGTLFWLVQIFVSF